MRRFTLQFLFFLFVATAVSQQRDLNFYLEKAKETSPLIQKNRNDNKVLDLDLQQTERALKSFVISLESNVLLAPIISSDAFPTTFDVISSSSVNYIGYDLGITNGGQYQAFVSVKKPLLGKDKLKAYTFKTDISRKQNENATKMTIHQIEQLVGYQYILCLKSKMQIKNGEVNLKQLNDQLYIMHKLVESAVYKQSDLMLLEIEKQNLEISNKSFEDDYKTNIYDLNMLCGIQETENVDIQEIDLPMLSENIAESKFLMSYRLDSLNIMADQSISELKYKPQFDAFGNIGYNASGVPSLNRTGFSVGLNFSWTLYDGNQRKLELDKSKVNISTLRFERDYFKTQREINRDKIVSQMKAVDERGKLLEAQLNQYDKLYKTYSDELAHGLVSVMDFKNLLKDVTAKRQDFLMLKMEKQLLINSLNYWNF